MSNIREIFLTCKYERNTEHIATELKKLYKKALHNDFTTEFLDLLEYPLAYPGQDTAVDRIFQVCCRFALKLNQEQKKNSTDEIIPMPPFLMDLFLFLLKVQKAANYVVRLHACQLLGQLFCELGELPYTDAFYEEIICFAKERMLDTSSTVRAQAVNAVAGLQDPAEKKCPIIKTYLFLLSKDPHHVVRRNILSVIAVTKRTIIPIKDRIKDVHHSVRKTAILTLATKVSFHSFSASQHTEILEICLNDKSDASSKALRLKLLPAWLKACKNDYFALLRELDIYQSPQIVQEALNILFEHSQLKVLELELKLDSAMHVIPREKLTPEVAFFWRCLFQYAKSAWSPNVMDVLAPSISDFCSYLESYVNNIADKDKPRHSLPVDKIFILEQLLILASEMDFSDKFGWKKLHSLLLESLKSPFCSLEAVEHIVACFSKVQLEPNEFLKDIGMTVIEMNRDIVQVHEKIAMKKPSLKILSEALARTKVEEHVPEFIHIKEKLITPWLLESAPGIRNEIIRTLGLYSLIDIKSALENHLILTQAIMVDYLRIKPTGLRAMFDTILCFGPKLFNTTDAASYLPSDSLRPDEADNFSTLINEISALLDVEEEGLRTLAAEGLGKLMLWGRISSAQLFSRLLLMCYSPSNDDDLHLKQFLSVFMPAFVSARSANQDILEDAFMITLETVFDAPPTSILSTIDTLEVTHFFLQLTSTVEYKQPKSSKSGAIHNNLAQLICQKILQDTHSSSICIMAKILSFLTLSDDGSLNNLYILNTKAQKVVKGKTALDYLKKFSKNIIGIQGKDAATETVTSGEKEISSLHPEEENNVQSQKFLSAVNDMADFIRETGPYPEH